MGWSWMTGYDRWWMWLVNRIVMTGEGCNGLRLGPPCVDYMPPSVRRAYVSTLSKIGPWTTSPQMKKPCGPEEFALAIAKHFVDNYPLVSKAKVFVEMEPWKRISVDGVVSPGSRVLDV